MRFIYMCVIGLSSILIAISSNSQESTFSINSSQVIEEGISLYNKGKYKEAIETYQKVSRSDTNYSLILQNLSVSEYADSNYIESKSYAEQGLQLYPEKANEWYNLIANNLDDLGKSQEAIEYYDKIFGTYKNQYIALVNKGIVFFKLKQLAEAKKCFQHALMINPYYASAHYQLGKVAYEEGNMVGAMLSFATNLLVNPENNLSNLSIKMLSTIAKGSDDVVKKTAAYKPSSSDDFSTVQEILISKLALDPQYKNQSQLEDAIVRQLQVIFEKLPYNPSDKGFWMQYYVPIYEQLFKNDQFDPLVFYLFRSLDLKEIKAYVKKNSKKIDAFIPQATTYFNTIKRTEILNVAERSSTPVSFLYNGNNLIGKGKIVGEGDKALFVGDWEFYHENGGIKSRGFLNEKQEKTGEWLFYYADGNLKEKSNYKEGKAEGKSLMWFNNGNLNVDAIYKEGELNGAYSSFYYNGLIRSIENYIAGKKNGTVKGYTPYGTLDYTANYKNDKEDGLLTNYYKNGKPSSVVVYTNGEPEGIYKSYFVDGTPKFEGSFAAGKRVGLWKEYFNNSKISNTTNYVAGQLEGAYEDFMKMENSLLRATI